MSHTLSVHLLGGAILHLNGTAIEGLSSQKAKALFFYIACQPRPVARETLAELLFGDRPTEQAFSNLRTLLARLKPIADYLVAERHSIGLHPALHYDIDVREFVAEVATGLQTTPLTATVADALERALARYQGDFLAGFHIHDALAWEEWVLVERERLLHHAIEGYDRLVSYCLENGYHERGIAAARRLLHLDPLREETYRQLMTLLARDNQRLAALALYEQCRVALAEEMGVDPSPDTAALHHRLLTLELEEQTEPNTPAVRPHNLTRTLTPFVGREAERTQIRAWLDAPEGRLLTVVGAGGMGKSRLALQAAWDMAVNNDSHFSHGVFWVALAGTDAASSVPLAIAEAVGLELQGKTSPAEQLRTFLGDKALLLVLDNLEQLLDAAPEIVTLLQSATALKILATSRERLNVQSEWVLKLDGLPYPREEEALPLENIEACSLFLQHTRRLRPDFVLTAEDHAPLVRLCRLLGGMPLGLELAATWMPHLSLAELVAELERDLDMLTVPLRDVPERHRSLRAVFEQSWRRLTPQEQELLARLAVFRGGFMRDAAEQVADASLRLLLSLEQNSLVRRDAAGRYDIHELVRQFALEKLVARGQADVAQQHHTAYFLRLVERQTPRLLGRDVVAAMELLRSELDNHRAAWHHTIAAQDTNALARAGDGIYRFYSIRTWYQEGVDALVAATAMVHALPHRTPADERVYGLLLAWQAKLLEVIAVDTSQALYEQALAHLTIWGTPVDSALPLIGLGYLAQLHGQYETAEHYLQRALSFYRNDNDQHGEASVLNHLCQTRYRQGNLAAAKAAGLESTTIRRGIGDVLGLASSLVPFGLVLCQRGEYDAGEAAFSEALRTFRDLNMRVGMANALNGLVQTAFARRDMEQAIRYVRDSYVLYQEIGDAWGAGLALSNLGFLENEQTRYDAARPALEEAIAIFRKERIKSGLTGALRNLGNTYRGIGDHTTAAQYYHESLQVAHDSGSVSYMLQTIVHYARLLWLMGAKERSVAILTFASAHPALRHDDRERAEAWLAEQTPQPDNALHTDVTELTLETIYAALLSFTPRTDG